MKILSIGSAILDKISYTNVLPKKDEDYDSFDSIELGGCAANVAVALAQLGAESSILCTIGTDVDGEFIKQELLSKDVKIDAISQIDGKTGYCKCYVDKEAERNFFNYDGVNLSISDEFIKDEVINKFDAIYIAGYELVEKELAKKIIKAVDIAKKHNVLVYFDPSPEIRAIDLDILNEVISKSDYVILNRDEANAYANTLNIKFCVEALLEQNPKNVIVKLGNEGCYFANKERSFQLPSFKVEAIDTNGAGDSFVAGHIFGHLSGKTEEESCRFANAVASIIVQSKGSQAPNLTLEAVEEIING